MVPELDFEQGDDFVHLREPRRFIFGNGPFTFERPRHLDPKYRVISAYRTGEREFCGPRIDKVDRYIRAALSQLSDAGTPAISALSLFDDRGQLFDGRILEYLGNPGMKAE